MPLEKEMPIACAGRKEGKTIVLGAVDVDSPLGLLGISAFVVENTQGILKGRS